MSKKKVKISLVKSSEKVRENKKLTALKNMAYASQTHPTVPTRLPTLVTQIRNMIRNVKRDRSSQFIPISELKIGGVSVNPCVMGAIHVIWMETVVQVS